MNVLLCNKDFFNRLGNDSNMQFPTQFPPPDPESPERQERTPATADEPDFSERHDDPDQAEELDRQQDA
jgi:hypothetical protein